jgi:hypothetical protein
MEELRAEVRRYRPVDVLARCRALSLALSNNRGAPLEIPVPAEIDKFGKARVIRVAPHVVALIARLSLMEGSRLAPGTLTDLRFMRILRIWSELYEPGMSGMTILLRAWDEQAGFQRNITHVIGRGLMWYRDIPRVLPDPEFDLPQAFEAEMGMTAEDFFGCSFLVFSLASDRAQHSYQFYTTIRLGVLTERAKELLAADVMKRFLSAASIDQAGFQDLARRWNPESGGLSQYDLNPLLERPLIYIDGSGYIAPNPDLLIWMMDEQPYWRLRTRYKGDSGDQPFGRFFGKHIFERYVGDLIADRMPRARALAEAETAYGPKKERKFGPDWLVVQDDIGIAIELVLATIPRAGEGDEEGALTSILERDVTPRVSGMPAKIEGVIAGRPDLELSAVRRWHRLVVTKSPLPWIGLTKPKYLDPLIDPSAMPYHVLSLEDFETLLAAEANYGVAQILALAEEPTSGADFRRLCSTLYAEQGKPFYYGRLNDIANEFFSQFLPPEEVAELDDGSP